MASNIRNSTHSPSFFPFLSLGFAALLFLHTLSAIASTDENIFIGRTPSTLVSVGQAPLPPQEAFTRTQAVLQHFQVPPEEDSPLYLSDLAEHYALPALTARLPLLDPLKTFQRFLEISGADVSVFQDHDSRTILDLTFNLNQAALQPSLKDRIKAAQNNPADKIFAGLKIALDPGHMGSEMWDRRTGKYVSDGNRKISEGVINLQVCLLLKKDLESLGATVLITHEGLSAVSKLDPDKFDLSPFSREELLYHSMDPWFQNLIASAPAGPALYKNFEQSSSLQGLFSESMRDNYFIKRADLIARADLMTAFSPDITLYIHHDTAFDSGVSDKSPSMTRAFIPGSFQDIELADRASRRCFMRHWIDQEAWDLSVQLIRKTLGQVKSRMGIPLATFDGEQSVKVEDGIFARNLAVPRRMRNTVTAYYEMFFYDRRQEFNALLDYKYSMTIDGVNYPYSERLRLSAESLREGLIDFVKTAQ